VRLPDKAGQDPRFRQAIEKLEKTAATTRSHPPPARKAAEAQAASVPPSNERLAAAQTNQVEAMGEAPAGKPQSSSFLELLRAEIEKVMPKSLGETEHFMEGGRKEQLKSATTGNIDRQKQEAAGSIKTTASQAPNPSQVPARQATPLPAEAPVQPSPLDAGAAMPAAKPAEAVSLEKSKAETNQSMADADVTPEQLKKANEPTFSAVLESKAAAERHADTAPAGYRAAERGVLAESAAGARKDERTGLTALGAQQGKASGGVKSRQQLAKEKDEARRKEVADTIERIYADTKAKVEAKLGSLDSEVSKTFDTGAEEAVTTMKDFVNARLMIYKADRYGGLLGPAKWFKDKLVGLPSEVKVFYAEGRKIFVTLMDRLVVKIANLVERRLKEAKDEVANGQKRLRQYVEGLPKDLQAIGKAAEREVAGRFEELRQGVDDKKNDLAQNLAQRYKDATEKADAELNKIQEANKGLVTAFVQKLKEVAAALRRIN